MAVKLPAAGFTVALGPPFPKIVICAASKLNVQDWLAVFMVPVNCTPNVGELTNEGVRSDAAPDKSTVTDPEDRGIVALVKLPMVAPFTSRLHLTKITLSPLCVFCALWNPVTVTWTPVICVVGGIANP